MSEYDKEDRKLLLKILVSEINVSIANIKELEFQINLIDKNWINESVVKDLIYCEYLIRKSEYLNKLAYAQARLFRMERIVKYFNEAINE